MDKSENSNGNRALSLLPSIDLLLKGETSKKIEEEAGKEYAAEMARDVTDSLRKEILAEKENPKTVANGRTRDSFLAEAERRLADSWISKRNKRLKKVINATGVIIHTNLGRAPLSENAKEAMIKKASGYCDLEYDLDTGERGKRGASAEKILAELTGAEAALIVNNCAAAAILVLTALGSGGEAIISRGELVEIGGDFRVPDVMAQSGTGLVEVGTTNRTKLADYENAINENTRLILKVHPSNYRIVGFTSVPDICELAALAHEKGLLFYEDAGSGALRDLSDFGLCDEPIIGKSIAAGADVVTFSGDKLIGGPQAGLVVGRREVIEKIRKHPLYRALRASKLVYAGLEATLEAFRRGTHRDEIPVQRMLSVSADDLRHRTRNFASVLAGKFAPNSRFAINVIEGRSVVGGGSAPDVYPETTLLSVTSKNLSANEIEARLRKAPIPVIARVWEDQLAIDLRTVGESEEKALLDILIGLSQTS